MIVIGWTAAYDNLMIYLYVNGDSLEIEQDAQLSQKTALQGALVLAKSGRLELRDNILRTS